MKILTQGDCLLRLTLTYFMARSYFISCFYIGKTESFNEKNLKKRKWFSVVIFLECLPLIKSVTHMVRHKENVYGISLKK